MARELFRALHALLRALEVNDAPSLLEQELIQQIRSVYVREAAALPLLENDRLVLVSYLSQHALADMAVC
jgi:hypothetical protein